MSFTSNSGLKDDFIISKSRELKGVNSHIFIKDLLEKSIIDNYYKTKEISEPSQEPIKVSKNSEPLQESKVNNEIKVTDEISEPLHEIKNQELLQESKVINEIKVTDEISESIQEPPNEIKNLELLQVHEPIQVTHQFIKPAEKRKHNKKK